MTEAPLAGTLVLDFSQFLSGPVAAMRLADLGARVIKIERPSVGDIGRTLSFAGAESDGDTLSFQIMNRNKEGVAADLKAPADLAAVRALVARADVIIQNFRPGVMERIGLDYPSVQQINPRLIYASISGYGTTGPWTAFPGQDLLAQAVSGLPWLNGSRHHGPVPVGLAIADLLASVHLATGVCALLTRRGRTGEGGLVETSLLEGMLDLQFEVLAARLNDPTFTVHRGGDQSAHGFLPAPYGVYPTRDGYLALAMNDVPTIGRLLELPALLAYTDSHRWWGEQEDIQGLLAIHLRSRDTANWLAVLQAADVWCAEVLTLDSLLRSDGYSALEMDHEVVRSNASGDGIHRIRVAGSPLRIDGLRPAPSRGAPRLGEHTDAVFQEFGIGRRSLT